MIRLRVSSSRCDLPSFNVATTASVTTNNKVSSVVGRDDSWPATVPSVVPTGDCSHTFTSPTGQFLSELAQCQLGNTQNGGTVLPIANLMADSESGSPSSYSRFIVTISLSRLVSEIFTRDRQTDNADHYYSWPPRCGGQLIIISQCLNYRKTAVI